MSDSNLPRNWMEILDAREPLPKCHRCKKPIGLTLEQTYEKPKIEVTCPHCGVAFSIANIHMQWAPRSQEKAAPMKPLILAALAIALLTSPAMARGHSHRKQHPYGRHQVAAASAETGYHPYGRTSGIWTELPPQGEGRLYGAQGAEEGHR